MTSAETRRAAPADEPCHFAGPVRFGRRKSDQVGHLVLTNTWLKFCGRVDVSIAWGEIARVEQIGSQILVSLHGTRRVLCFCCSTTEEASRGTIIAVHLAALAQAEACHAV